MRLSPLSGAPAADGSDCVACGRCCHHGANTVSLLETDEARLSNAELSERTVLQERPPYMRFMKTVNGACGMLDRSVPGHYPCSIYPRRPDGCRAVAAGSPACLEARALGMLGSSVEFDAPRRG